VSQTRPKVNYRRRGGGQLAVQSIDSNGETGFQKSGKAELSARGKILQKSRQSLVKRPLSLYQEEKKIIDGRKQAVSLLKGKQKLRGVTP